MNVVAIMALVIDSQVGIRLTGAEAGAILVIINLIMRAVTSEPLER